MKSAAFYGALVFSVGVVICLCIISDASAIPWCRAPPVRRNWRHPRPPPVKKEKQPPLQLFSFMEPRGLPGRPQIALYQHINHRGFKYEQFVGNRCYNLPNAINDQASSIDTHGRCVMVCRDADCKFCRKMQPGSSGHFNLNEIGLDDVISSIKPCGEVYEL